MTIKPILLINCLITDDVFSIYDRGVLASHSKFDVFKYMLKTVSVLDYERIFIQFTLADNYKEREGELIALIAECLPAAEVRNRRLERYGEWLDFIEEKNILSGEPILLMCNDDHIYLGSDKPYFSRIMEGYQELLKVGPLVSVVYSHWQETRRYHAPLSLIQTSDDYDISLSDNSHDGIQMVSPELMRRWFYDESAHLARDTLIRRSEDLGPAKDVVFKLIPKRELFRHFDGYSSSGIGIKQCSPLTIPIGFFEKGMKVCFANLICMEEAESLMQQGYTVCSSATALVGELSLSQPVYDVTPETIPLSWHSQIMEVSYYGTYQEKFGRICQKKLRLGYDFNRPQQHRIYLDRSGAFAVEELSAADSLRPYPGFHKTATRSTKKTIVLLQDVRFYKRDQVQQAIDNAANALALHGISLHLLLLYTSNVLFQGRMFAVLNNLLGNSHALVDSVVSLNCSESIRSRDVGYFMDSLYGDTKLCICHNADPIRGLPIMIDVLANNEKYFPNDHATVSFVAAGIPNVFGASTNILMATSRQLQAFCQSEKQMGPDIVESMLNQMEEEGMGAHSAKVLSKT